MHIVISPYMVKSYVKMSVVFTAPHYYNSLTWNILSKTHSYEYLDQATAMAQMFQGEVEFVLVLLPAHLYFTYLHQRR